MKIIWSILALICLAALAAVFWPRPNDTRDDAVEQVATATTKTSPVPATGKVAPAPAVTPSPSQSSAQPTSQVAATPPAAVAPAKPKAPAAAISPDSLKDGLDQVISNAKVVPGNIIRQADGSILADNKYLITGSGTAQDPYKVTWECLTSASQTFIPRLQQNEIPQRIALLNDHWIRIEGYLAFPLMLQESSEILAMLNQWDGCCIGVPPTPYDAIEVKLSEPVKPARRHTFNFGTVTGKFKVDPYLVENWLVGLYQLDAATLQSDM